MLTPVHVQPDEHARLYDLLPFYARMPRTGLFASLSWRAARDVLALHATWYQVLGTTPRCARLPGQ